MTIRALRSLAVYAVYCEVDESAIEAEMLILNEEEFDPGIHTLIDVDKEEQGIMCAYTVEIPDLKDNPAYKVSLNLCPSPSIS